MQSRQKPSLKLGSLESPLGTAGARVLSYNFNILPRWCGGYQQERVQTFLDSVDAYDVLLLQEVYAASILPYALQKRFCFKTELLEGLKKKGFHHYVTSRQPSYTTIASHHVVTDNGLIIASRFPIRHRGSYTFRHTDGNEQTTSKGCLFAEIEFVSIDSAAAQPVIFFNVHLRPEERTPSDSSQVQQLVRLVDSVTEQVGGNATCPEERLPFVIAGDFNIHGIDANSHLPSKSLTDFMSELQPLGELHDVISAALGHNPPTRPPKLFFPTQSKLERYEDFPQRQDYFLVSANVNAKCARLEKFVVSSRRPYTYLSDHFGLTAEICVPVKASSGVDLRSPSRVIVDSLVGEVDNEKSHHTSGTRLETFAVCFLAWLVFYVSIKPVVLVVLLWGVVYGSRYTYSGLPAERLSASALVTDDVVKGVGEVHLPSTVFDPLTMAHTLAEVWERSVVRFRTLRCLGSTGDMGQEEWLSYGAVDSRARALGAGLLQLGLSPGDKIGVECEACVTAAILDLTCALYGFATVPLAGKGSMVRALLDHNKVSVVFAGRSSVVTLLTCRSTSLETIVHLHPFADRDDQAAAKDLNVQLISIDSIEHSGKLAPRAPPRDVSGSSVFTYSMDNVSTAEFSTLIPVTHSDTLRDIGILLKTSVLPNYFQNELMVWFTTFASLFNRICVLGLYVQGNSIATTASAHLHEAFVTFRPTLLVASPSLFSTSSLQLLRAQERYSALYNWLFKKASQVRSQLIHVSNRDASVLRFLFFRSFQSQLGGRVRSIVLNTAQESIPFYLVEHITLCYSPCLREVSHLTKVGVCTVDRIPSPQLRVQLQPMDNLSQSVGIGQLTVTPKGMAQNTLEVAAMWERDHTLSLLGSADGILWPVSYQYAISVELERVFAGSRYINDIFVFCEPLKPIIAVVFPNRDTVEYEWNQQNIQSSHADGADVDSASTDNDLEPQPITSPRQLKWTEMAEYATELITKDLTLIAEEQHLHHSQVPRFVHLHPHSFRDHSTFLTPFGKIRRSNVHKYFAPVFERFYNGHETASSSASASEGPLEVFSEMEASVRSTADCSNRKQSKFSLRVPATIDIGGTFAKIAYVMPPGMREFAVSSAVIHEASSLSDKLGLRTLAFFSDPSAAEQELQVHPRSFVGTLRFAKIPSQRLPQFAEFLSSVHAVGGYKPEFTQRVRATGGGAFKYSSLAQSALGITFDVVKEMDAVVKGLNLILQVAPESIFTVESSTGRHMPHKLVSTGEEFSPFPYMLINIGSGISFIKCTGPDGAHVRVGGTPIGGATFWGLTRTMTNLTSWEEVMEIMQLDGPGDNKNVDLLVGDIYGYNAKDMPAMLSSEMVASSFGKFGTERFYDASRASPADHFANDDDGELLSPLSGGSPKKFEEVRAQERASSIDIVRSLLFMIAGNVTQLAFLHSKNHDVKNVFFAGGFVRDNPIVWSTISSTMQYWSAGERSAHFLEHDGYLGALGCTILEDDALTSPSQANGKAA